MILDPSQETAADAATLESLLTASPYLFCELNREGEILRLNPRAEAQFGYGTDALLGSGILALVHPEDRMVARDAIADAEPASRAPIRLRFQDPNGFYRRLEWDFSFDAESGRVLCWGRDISERVAVREELQARIEILTNLLETRTRQFAEALTALEDENRGRNAPRARRSKEGDLCEGLPDRIPMGILRASPDQRILGMNAEMRRLLGGLESGELVGENLRVRLWTPFECPRTKETTGSTSSTCDQRSHWRSHPLRSRLVRVIVFESESPARAEDGLPAEPTATDSVALPAWSHCFARNASQRGDPHART